MCWRWTEGEEGMPERLGIKATIRRASKDVIVNAASSRRHD
jgi:hypothetical protein